MNRHLVSTEGEFGADIIISRLAAAGIHAWRQHLTRGGQGGVWDLYVDETDLERAQLLLAENEDFDEQELTRLAEESGPPPPD